MDSEWLTISAAARLLGIHPSTVRLWADKGILPVQRTHGGHRRFRRQDIELWKQNNQPQDFCNSETMLPRLLQAIRIQISEGALEQQSWYAKLDDNARTQYRISGKHLLKGLLFYLSSQDEAEGASEAHALGYEYASRARRYQLRCSEAIQAFLFFRNALYRGVYALLEQAHLPFQHNHRELLDRMTTFTDLILLNLTETYLMLEKNAGRE